MREPKQITAYNHLKQMGWKFSWKGISGDFFLEKNGDIVRVTTNGKVVSHNNQINQTQKKAPVI